MLMIWDYIVSIFKCFHYLYTYPDPCYSLSLPQSLASVLKKKVSVDKEHVKTIHKMTQSMHEDAGIRQLKFEGLVHVVIIRLRACTRMLVSDNSSLKG